MNSINTIDCEICKNYKEIEYKKESNNLYINTNMYNLHILKSKEQCEYNLLFKSKIYKYNNMYFIKNCCFNKIYNHSKTIIVMLKKYNNEFSYINQELFKLNSNNFKFQFTSTRLPTLLSKLPTLPNSTDILKKIIKIKLKYKKSIKLYKEKNMILSKLLDIQNKRIRDLEEKVCNNKKIKT